MYKAEMYERKGIQSIHYTHTESAQVLQIFLDQFFCSLLFFSHEKTQEHDLLDPNPISLGTKLPHFVTDHTVCSSRSQKKRMTTRQTRVKSGRRRIYERKRAGLKNGRGGKGMDEDAEEDCAMISLCRCRHD